VVRVNLTTVIASEARQSINHYIRDWIASSFFMHHLFQKPLRTHQVKPEGMLFGMMQKSPRG
jgi:hypothetical protein